MSSYVLDQNPENLWAETVTIKNGTSVADAVYTQGHALVGIQMPTGWDAANLGFDVSVDNNTYQVAKDASGNFEQSIAAASTFICIPLSDAIFAPYLKVKSVVTATPTVNTAQNQSADRVIILLFRRYLGGS